MQAEQGNSVAAQLAAIREYAERENIKIVAEFKDEGKSAYRDDVTRSQFEKMLQLAKKDDRISLILVHDPSRFYRKQMKAVITKAELKQYGVRVVPVVSPYDDSLGGF